MHIAASLVNQDTESGRLDVLVNQNTKVSRQLLLQITIESQRLIDQT